MFVNEATLLTAANVEVGDIAACQKTMLLIGKKDLSAAVHPNANKMGRAVSVR